jgi:drug/metabolite transporter (DMT)-like permease
VTFSLFVGYQALQCFQTTTVVMVQNLSPLVMVVLAFLMLNDSLTMWQFLQLAIGFAAVSLVILGGDSETDKVYSSNLFELIMLFCNPLAVALGQIFMRKMMSTSEWTVTCWVNLV